MKFFYLFSLSLLISLTSLANYNTPGTGVKWSLDDLVTNASSAVSFSSGVYMVNDTITINANDTLAITANATVKFAANTYIYAYYGVLLVTPPNSVLFTAQNTATGYNGLRIEFSNATVLKKLTLEYAVSCRISDCSPTIDSCVFQYNNNSTSTSFGNGAIALFRSSPNITNSKFLNNQRAAIQGGSNISNAPKIIGCYFEGNNTTNQNVPQINLGASGPDTTKILNNQILRASTNSGGIGFLPTADLHVVISGNVIKNNRYGLTFTGGSLVNALVSYNVVDSNNTGGNPNTGGSGISFTGGSATSHQNTIVTGNLFRWNLWGITIQNFARPNLGNLNNTDTTDDGKNQFIGNTNTGTPNIDLYNNTVDSIYAQNNYWGTVDPAIAETHIYHYTDAPSLGFVTYLPLYDSSVVPVKLTGFTATLQKNDVLLKWQTATEINSDYFAIEKSKDGLDFYQVGKVTATGNSSGNIAYSFTDVQALTSGIAYYRLKLVDKDGKSAYSPIVLVKLSKNFQLDITKVYPTRFSGNETINAEILSGKIQTVTIQFVDATGKVLAQVNKGLTEGSNKINFEAAGKLPSGVLYLRFITDDAQQVIPVIKQ